MSTPKNNKNTRNPKNRQTRLLALLRRTALPALLLVLGSAILAFGLYNVHSQCSITEGGVLGATLLLHHWAGLSPSVSAPLLDAVCYLLGARILGAAFLKKALFCSASFALCYAGVEQIGPVLPSLAHAPLLASLVGGCFVGLGVGLVVRAGGALGGDDALALILCRGLHCPISRAYLLTDVTVLLLSLSYLPFSRVGYSLVTVTVSSCLIGLLQKRKP